jgi:hypothetical protein
MSGEYKRVRARKVFIYRRQQAASSGQLHAENLSAAFW